MTKRRRRTTRKSTAQPKSAISPLMIGVVVVGALLIVIGFIMLGNQSPREAASPANVSQFPALGVENAPVTMVEYSDYG